MSCIAKCKLKDSESSRQSDLLKGFKQDGSNAAQPIAFFVVTALKCCGLRHMAKRRRLTRFLVDKLQAGSLPHTLPVRLSTEEQAFYLQGVFFNTAVVQMSEAMVHVLMVLAKCCRAHFA